MNITRRTISRSTGKVVNDSSQGIITLGPEASYFFVDLNVEDLQDLPTKSTIFIDMYGNREFCRFKVFYPSYSDLPQKLVNVAEEMFNAKGKMISYNTPNKTVKRPHITSFERQSTEISLKRLLKSLK